MIGALVPVRLASERLPGKALLPLAGRPAITHLLDRLCASRYLEPDRIVVCTTTDPSDDPLVPVVTARGVQVFRGSRDDIIDRFHHAVEAFGFALVIQADGDDPCTDPEYMDRCVDRLLADDSLDVVVAEGLPLGLGSKAIRASAIHEVWRRHLTTHNDTGFIYYFTHTDLCRCDRVLAVSPEHRHDEARLTLDYPEDYTLLQALFEALFQEGDVFGAEEIVALLRQRPELVELNTGRSTEYWQRTRERAQLEYVRDGRALRIDV